MKINEKLSGGGFKIENWLMNTEEAKVFLPDVHVFDKHIKELSLDLRLRIRFQTTCS